ncbi:hypothetical protein [Brumimicrobium mesophilum]|uniref:hypothetical protein n=1 Tax=Brumimicrobium mesophilum TaxID=392717 RepID=UPI000D140B27|nr:hypothetical protein [Brumimicrobium mesophilum]
MKNTFFNLALLIFCFTFGNLNFAQDIEVNIGKETKTEKRETIASAHHAGDDVIVLKSTMRLLRSNNYFLEIFDEKMDFVKRNEITLPDDDLNIYQMMYVNEKIYMFMLKNDKREEKNTLYGTTINRDGKFDSDIFELKEVDILKSSFNLFTISLSEDSTHFLVQSSPWSRDEDQDASSDFLIVDLDFQEVDNVSINFPYNERDFSIRSIQLDAKGNIHMLTSIAIEETRRKTLFNTSVEKEARVFTLYKGESEVEEYEINLLNEEAGFISQIKMKTDKLGRLQCAGFYSDKKGNSTRGVFAFTIDTDTKEISNVSSQEFTDEYLNQFLSDKQIRKKERKSERNAKKNPYERLYNYRIRDIVMKKGGGFYMVAEYYELRVTTTTTSNGATRTTYHYYYNDLMVIDVLKDNSVEWYARVPKRQHSTNDGGRFSGIITGLNNDNSLNIIFNDNTETSTVVDHDNSRSLKLKKSTVVLVKFEEDGNATKTPLFSSKELKTYVIPGASPVGRENDLVLYSLGKKKNRFTNVILN